MDNPVITTSEDRDGRILAIYIKMKEGLSSRTKELIEGRVLADFDESGNLLGIEVLP